MVMVYKWGDGVGEVVVVPTTDKEEAGTLKFPTKRQIEEAEQGPCT